MDRKRKGTKLGDGPSGLKSEKLDREALGVSSLHHNYKLYSILNRLVTDKETKELVELKNNEKPRELLDFLLNMGNANSFRVKTIKEAEEAIDLVFDRDHDWGDNLLKGLIKVEDLGALAIPEIFLSKVPDVLDHDAFPQKRKDKVEEVRKESPVEKFPISKQGHSAKYTSVNGVPVPKDHEGHGNLSGDKWERLLYYSLKKYFENTKDACLIIHGHSFLHENNFKEKDFIILNLSKGYIMGIEVKASCKQFNHAKEQIKDCRRRIQAVLDCIPGMSSLWKFIGVCCIGDGCYKNDFIINGSDLESDSSFKNKLGQIEKKLDPLSWSSNQSRIKEFVNIAKHLLFIAQGDSKAPLTKEKLIKKVDEDLDKASAPENILFWTPEQLSIVQAMHMDWMFLMGYYGCGKTILLIERAEYLLRNPSNTVHFYIDKLSNSGLVEVLKLRFAGKNIKIKTQFHMFDGDFDMSSDGVNPSDHVIIDEAKLEDSEGFLKQLKKFQSQVSTLWVALGYVNVTNFNESDFRKGLEDIQFSCPTLKHCLRNGQKIVEEAQKDNTKKYGLNCFADQVEVKSKSNVNDGLLHEMPLIYPNRIKALQEAFKFHHSKKNFIFMEERLDMSTLKEAIPDHDFVNFQNKDELKKWLESSNINQHLVLQDSFGYNSEVSGMEFQSMIHLSQICLKCGFEYKNSSVITRAKASLLLARYERQNCFLCKNNSYPNLKWNKESKKWKIEQGFQLPELTENSIFGIL